MVSIILNIFSLIEITLPILILNLSFGTQKVSGIGVLVINAVKTFTAISITACKTVMMMNLTYAWIVKSRDHI
jgi:hypothetical protein